MDRARLWHSPRRGLARRAAACDAPAGPFRLRRPCRRPSGPHRGRRRVDREPARPNGGSAHRGLRAGAPRRFQKTSGRRDPCRMEGRRPADRAAFHFGNVDPLWNVPVRFVRRYRPRHRPMLLRGGARGWPAIRNLVAGDEGRYRSGEAGSSRDESRSTSARGLIARAHLRRRAMHALLSEFVPFLSARRAARGADDLRHRHSGITARLSRKNERRGGAAPPRPRKTKKEAELSPKLR